MTVYVHSLEEWLIKLTEHFRTLETHDRLVEIGEKVLRRTFHLWIEKLSFEEKVEANGSNYILDIYVRLKDGTEIAFEAGVILNGRKVYDLTRRFKYVLHLPYGGPLKIFTKENAPENYVCNKGPRPAPYPMYIPPKPFDWREFLKPEERERKY